MINENVQKLKNTIRAGRAMHGYLVTSADCDETAPEGEPSSTAELLRQCAALLLFGSEKTEMLEFSPDFYELNGGAKVEQMRMIRQELSKKAFGGNQPRCCNHRRPYDERQCGECNAQNARGAAGRHVFSAYGH